jgi:hypothetical protein
MPAPTYTVPDNNADTATEEPKITIALSDLKTLLTGNLDDDNVAPSGLTDASLANPNNSVYRTILSGAASVSDAFSLGGRIGIGFGELVTSTVGGGVLPLIQFVAADYAVAGKTTKMRLRVQVAGNATGEPGTFTLGLHPVTVAGGADVIVYTLGTAVTNSTKAIVAPAASTVVSDATADFTVPADGAYALGCQLPSVAANAVRGLTAQLQIRNV